MDNQFIVFELEREFFGIPIAAVESIVKMQPVTPMPEAPAFVEGVTNLRGRLLPVINLRKRFGRQAQEASKDSRIIAASTGDLQVGILVDAVSEVLTLGSDQIEPPPSIIAGADSSYLTGIAKTGSRLISLLDLQRVLSLEKYGAVSTRAIPGGTLPASSVD